ncbi:MAG: valine--tRNA ligase [Syntrophomonadaceae bacterium]|nr:valine--tRNA ligase [Syntrophomonadaceae bacterium]
METGKQRAAVYEPAEVEQKWYGWWRERGYFRPSGTGESFTVVMPPPNVTGQLHLGHALDNTIQDILIRWRRMQGFNTLWVPGTDHAGIATQAKVEEALAQEGVSRQQLGREAFLERVWEWKNLYGDRITRQLCLLGSSCDWERERFTMDENCSRAVREVFVNLYEEGLIYQGDYIVNWCPRCLTAISDIEVEHEDEDGGLWYLKYPVEDSDEFIVVATTRPETMLGDTGVAVHPEDERYRGLVGKMVVLPLVGRKIPVFADDYVDREFGTGAVKVTPAHDPNDFDMGQRHGLDTISVMNLDGTMNEAAGDAYAGMDRYACREAVVNHLRARGALLEHEVHRHAVGHCQRCNTVVEPMVSRQWFVRMQPLAKPAIETVLSGDTRFVPERFTRIYINWMENIRDWCISRQLWWGHRIPVWYCDSCGEVICSKSDPTACPGCGHEELRQDEDVLDTWFSSALWPFSTLGWPEDTADMQTFYPTSVLVTGRDIIFFWVARMIFSGLHHAHKTPFHTVNIHGLILDGQGRKMSKSLNNGIDPIEVIEKYGADTLRFSLVTGVSPGNDIRFNWEKVENTRNFANKIWNASRFVLMNLDDYEPVNLEFDELTLPDKWIISRFQQCVWDMTLQLDAYDWGEAARSIYDFIWDDFCDWYIELCKQRLTPEQDTAKRRTAQNVLRDTLNGILALLHPFMPFLSEELYQALPGHGESLMIQAWPQADEGLICAAAIEEMNDLMAAVRGLRNIRAEFRIPAGAKLDAVLLIPEAERRRGIIDNQEYIIRLARLESLRIEAELPEKPVQSASVLSARMQIYVPLEGLIDIGKEKERLLKELKSAEAEAAKAEGKLNNEKFTAQAPPEVIAKERAKAEEARQKKEGVLQRLHSLNS